VPTTRQFDELQVYDADSTEQLDPFRDPRRNILTVQPISDDAHRLNYRNSPSLTPIISPPPRTDYLVTMMRA